MERLVLVVAKLDRLARSVPGARDIVEELTGRGVRLQLGGSVHDPTDPVERLPFDVVAMVAEFEADPIKQRTREGVAVAKAKGRRRGRRGSGPWQLGLGGRGGRRRVAPNGG